MRTELVQKEKKAEETKMKEILDELEKLEAVISKIVSEDNRNREADNFKFLKKDDEATNYCWCKENSQKSVSKK